MAHEKFHGRMNGGFRPCAHLDCAEFGEFRAPNPYGRAPDANGPGDWLWFCLDHVRAFNARYDFFEGMSRDEIEAAQLPAAGWATETRVFSQGSVDSPPKWADFADPLDAISARFRNGLPKERTDGVFLSREDREALQVLGLSADADRKAIRTAYSALARKYHPDRNGGDRSYEKRLQSVVEAYQRLRTSPVFATEATNPRRDT